MSNILSYPLIPAVAGDDLLIISDISVKGNPTRSVRVDQLVGDGSGSVLSVDASINGDAVTITGGPITYSGTLAFEFGGLSTQYVNGLGNLVTFPAISGGSVTSVAQTHGGDAFTVGGSPITSLGTLAITMAGDATQYVNGLGNLALLSSIPSVGTTYDLTSIQNGTAVDVHLTGSDATVDTIQLVAGTNITLTDDGLNNITIDAAGGGSGTVTSVGLSHMGNAFAVTPGSTPVTSIGTLAVTMAGTNLEYINGAGDRTSLSTLPSGSVTSVASGPGITATPSPITGAGSIEVDYLGLDNVILSGGALITDAVSSDYILLSEAKNNNCAHSLISDLPGYYTNFFAAADTGSANSIGQAETLTLTGGDSINTATSSPGITTISLAYKSVVLRLLPPIGVGLPTITVVQNDLGSTLALTSTSVGEYVLSTSGGTGNFGTNVIAFIENPNEYGANPPIYPQATTIRWKANTEIAIRSFDVATGTRANIAGIWNVCVEIRVYP